MLSRAGQAILMEWCSNCFRGFSSNFHKGKKLLTLKYGKLKYRIDFLCSTKYLHIMKFEFDPEKSDKNKKKHGIDFYEA